VNNYRKNTVHAVYSVLMESNIKHCNNERSDITVIKQMKSQ